MNFSGEFRQMLAEGECLAAFWGTLIRRIERIFSGLGKCLAAFWGTLIRRIKRILADWGNAFGIMLGTDWDDCKDDRRIKFWN